MSVTRVVRPSSTIMASDGPNGFRPRCCSVIHCVCGGPETDPTWVQCDPICKTDPRRPTADFFVTSGSCPICRWQWAEYICEECFLGDERYLYEPPIVTICPHCAYNPLAFPTVKRI
jgi:hypothetical protein